MTTLVFHHPVYAEHQTGYGHPERSDRIRAVEQALQESEFNDLGWREPPPAEFDQLALVHDPRYVEQTLQAIPDEAGQLQALDGDTIVSMRSGEAALRATGAVCAAIDAVIAKQADNAFCAVRPPGHHAEPAIAMGFCLFNSIAIGAFHARKQHGLERIAVVDFDVHHGNGTQAAFWSERHCLFISSHQSPLYPGTGSRSERGEHDNIVNIPLRPGSGSTEIRAAWQGEIEPALREFQPELLLVSAGFDAHAADPLASLRFTEDDYAWLTERLLEAAADCCDGRLVSALEGGYDLSALADSVSAHVRTLQQA